MEEVDMCRECGCGSSRDDNTIKIFKPSEIVEGITISHHEHSNQLHLERQQSISPKHINIDISLLHANNRIAERNRGFFYAKGLFVINMISSPGSGKTTLLAKSADLLHQKGLRLGVIVGDLASCNDASKLEKAGIPAVQVTTGRLCHLDAQMIFSALQRLPLDQIHVLVIENVGNLVCPGDFDLGEACRVVLFSVTEGEDKPLKYPYVFHSANLVIISKYDLAVAAEFDESSALENVQRISHHAQIIKVSSKTSEGLEQWINWLVKTREEFLKGQCVEPIYSHH